MVCVHGILPGECVVAAGGSGVYWSWSFLGEVDLSWLRVTNGME